MKINTKLRTLAILGAVALGSIGGLTATAANAADDAASQTTSTGIVERDINTVSVEPANDEANLAKLNQLKGTQTSAEIAAIVSSEKKHVALLDTETNTYVAAFYVQEPTFTLFAISVRGPGCATTDACATTASGVPNGYYGTGQRDINLTNITKIFAGNRNTSFWYNVSGGSAADYVAAGATTYLSSARHYLSITRS
ncbi:hypothetical protein [Microbacterium hominis]|uniref:hypothetical protein n=1 Tax=Microbacterium hominis TaxID=162426 RepID=UPI0007686867|nr:hypothetical protein [Microbacterium hominis]KXC04521.1 hypothetical protein MhomT_15945 [Microbacterium hominis]